MAYIDEVVEKNKRYLTQAQVDALAAASRQYNAQNAAGRASAQASAREQYDTGYRGLQNMGLAGSVSGPATSGEVPRLRGKISAPFEDYNRRLRDVENRRLNALGGQFAQQTQAEEEARAAAEREAAARRAAAEAEQQRQAALRQAQLSAAAVVSKIQTAVKQQTAVDAATKAQLDGMKRTAALKQTTINSANVAGAKRTEQAQQQIAQDQMEIRAVAQLTGVKAASDSSAVKAANAAQERGAKLTSQFTGKETDTSTKIEYRTMTPYERAEQTKLERVAEKQNNTVSFFKKTGGEAESAQKALDQFKAGLNGYDAKKSEEEYTAAQKRLDAYDEAIQNGSWVPEDDYQQAVAQRDAAKLKAEDPDTYALLVVANSNLSKDEKDKAATSFIGKKFDKVDMDDAAQKFRNADQSYSRMLAEWEKEVGNAEQREKTLSELEDQYLHYKSILDIIDNPDIIDRDRAHARESLGVGGALTEEEARDMVAKYESFGQMPEKLQQAKEARAAAEFKYRNPETYRAMQILQWKDLLEDVSPDIVSDAAKIVSDYKLGQMFNAPAMSDEEYDSQKKDVKNVRDILRQIENAQSAYDNAGEAETEDIVSDKEHAKNDLDAAVRELQEKYGMTYEQANEWVEKFEIERDRRSEYNYYMPGMLAQTEHNGEKPTQPANEKEVNNIYRAVNGMQAVYFPEPMEGETENTSIAQYMTDEQKDAYNAIYEKEGLDAANQYYHDIVPYLNIQRAQQDEEKYREFADEHPVLASIASVGANMLWNIPAAAENLITGIQGMFTEERPYYDLNSDWSFRSNRADVIRSEVSQNILSNMNRPEWANTILNSAYQTGMSMADSAAAMGFAISGADWAVYALFSSSAGMSAYKDARARGATQDQALTLGILSGAAESIFEELSLEHLISMDYTGRGALIKNILSQAGVEGSEELTTGLANFLSDLYVMRDKSEYNDAVQKYLGQGVSKNTAEIRALLDQAAEIGLEGLGGAVSGALFGVGGKIVNEMSYKKYGSQLRNSSETIKRYSDLANLLGPETQKALAEYNENPTDRNAGKLYFAVNQAINGMLETQATDDTANDQMIDQSTALAALVSGEQINAATAEGIMKALGAETISGMGYDSSNSQAFADSYNSRLDEFKIQAKPGEITPRLKTNKEMKQATDRMLKSLRPSEERVWKDPDMGYAVTDDGRRIKTFPGNMTSVSAEEQKSSNYAARTMAVSGNVTYQIAGMEAREGLSDAQKISEIKKNLSREYKNKAEFYEKISKALPGVSFIVHDTMGMADGSFDKTTNSIHVSLSGRQSALRVTAHELTHLMKENAFEAYGELRQAIIDEIGQDRFERMCQQKAEEYTRAGDPIDYNTKAGKEKAEDETIAELCERMLNDSDWIERFCEEHTQAARTLSDYILKIVNAIKAALKDMTNRDFGSSWSGIIQAQNTFEKWGAALNTALENIANGTTQETAREQTNAKRAAEETAQAESTEQSDELYRSADDIRAEEAKKAAEESAQKKTYVPGFKAAEVERILDAGVFGDKSNYEGDDYEQARAMIAQLIPDMVSLLKKEGDIDAVVEKTKAVVGKMLDNYFEDEGDMAALREAIPSVIGVDSTAKTDLKAQDQSLFQMSAKLSKALGHPVTLVSEQNARGQKNAKYSSAEKLEEVWERVRDQFGLSDDQDFSIDTTKLLDFIEQQADTRKTFNDLYGKQRQEIIASTAVDILQAVKDMYSEKTGQRFSLDTDAIRSGHQINSEPSRDDYLAAAQVMQGLKKKSINQFSSADIKAAEPVARQYWKEMKTKSPFFRAWFGEWRAHDTKTNVTATPIDTSRTGAPGVEIENKDTGIKAHIGSQLKRESITHSKNKKRLSFIKEMIANSDNLFRNAFLLDSVSSSADGNKSNNAIMMHRFYGICDYKGEHVPYVMLVEEYYDENKGSVARRGYEIKNILPMVGYGSGGSLPMSITKGSVKNVADLYDVVKQYDKDFRPAHTVDPALLNDDGTPKKLYHGTASTFTVFDKAKIGKNYGASRGGDLGFYATNDPYAANGYATEAKEHASDSKNVMELYMSMANPLVVKDSGWGSAARQADVRHNDLMRWAKEGNHDGIIVISTDEELNNGDFDTVYVAFEPTQIKSATENIGTFNKYDERYRFSLDTDAIREARQAFTVIDTAGIEDGLEALKNVKNVGAFAMKDISRFLDAISHSSKDEEANKNLRNTLSAIFEKPHSEATGWYARGVERMQQRVLDIGVKAGVCDEKGGHFDSKKSAAIQNIGEGFSNTYTDLKLKVKDADRVTVRAYDPGTEKLVVSEKDYTLKELRQAYGTNVTDFVWGRVFDETQKAQAAGKEAGWLEETVNTRPYTLADLQDAFPNDWQKLKTAADEFRQMYDEYIRDQNNMLRTIYPIASEYDSVEKVEKTISKKQERLARHKVGVEQQIQNLQKSLEAKEKDMAGKKRTDTKAFRNLVEQANRITDKIAAVKAEIAEYEANINEELAVMNAEKAQMQNAVQSGESLKRMHRLQYRSDYFHHFQEMASGVQNLKAIFTNNTDISPAIVGKSENTKAKSRWAGYYQQRMGADYTADAMNGMLRYGQLAEYKLAFDPLVSYLRNVTEQIRTLDDNTNRDGLIKYLMAWTDNIAGKSHRLDRLISDAGMAPRKAMQVLNWINSRVIQNTLLFNMRSSLIQISNITNAKGIVTNNLDWFNGLRCWAAASKGNEAMQAIMAQSNFLASRYMDNMELTDSALKSAKKFAGWMLGALDEVSAKATWWAAYTQYQRTPNAKVIQNAYRAYDNAVDYADDVTRRTHAGRGVGELAPAMTSRVINFVAPFQVEINNTFEQFRDNVKRRNYLGLLSTGLSVFLFNAAFEAIVGSSPLQFDFIRAVLDIVLGFKNDDPDEDDDDYGLLQAWQRIAGEGIGSLPFAGQLVSIIGEDTAKKIFGEDNDATRYGNTQIGVSAVTNAGKGLYDIGKNLIEGKNVKQVNWISDLDDLVNLTLPMGGKQLTRSIQGLYTVAQGYGGKNDKEGKEQVQFVTDQDILHYIHGGLFGKWSLTEASEYFGEERLLPKLFGEYEGPKSSIGKPVDANEYKAALAAGIDGKDYFSLKYDLKEYTTQAGKRSEMMEQSFTPEQKAKLDALLFGSKDAEMKAEGAVVYQKNSDGEWKVKADYTNGDMFELSQNGDKTYTGTLAAMEKTGLPQDQAVLAANMWDQAKQADDSKTAFRDLLRDNKNLTVAQKEALDLQYCGNKYAADYSDPDLYEISITNRSTYEKAKQAKAQGIPVKEYVGLLDKKNDYSGEDKADYMRREIMNGNLTEKQKELLDDLLVSEKGRNPDYSSPAWFEISMLGGGQYNEAKEGAKIGLKPETYLTVYGKWKTLDAKDENGKTVNGLKKKRAKEYLDSLTVSAPVYDYIWTVVFGYKK